VLLIAPNNCNLDIQKYNNIQIKKGAVALK